MYSSYHLSFTSALPRSLLEELASLILADDPSGATGQLISSVHDQFLDFLVPSPNLFSLLPRREIQQEANGTVGKKSQKPREKEVEGRPSYVVLNDPRASELDIEEEVERVAKGLFSVAVTMGMSCVSDAEVLLSLTDEPAVTPIIRCPRGNAAEMVGRKLETKLRDHLAATSSQRGGGRDAYGSDALASLQRPCKLCVSLRWTKLTEQYWSFLTAISISSPCFLTRGHIRL